MKEYKLPLDFEDEDTTQNIWVWQPTGTLSHPTQTESLVMLLQKTQNL